VTFLRTSRPRINSAHPVRFPALFSIHELIVSGHAQLWHGSPYLIALLPVGSSAACFEEEPTVSASPACSSDIEGRVGRQSECHQLQQQERQLRLCHMQVNSGGCRSSSGMASTSRPYSMPAPNTYVGAWILAQNVSPSSDMLEGAGLQRGLPAPASPGMPQGGKQFSGERRVCCEIAFPRRTTSPWRLSRCGKHTLTSARAKRP